MKAKFATFAILLLFWIVLSGMFDAFHFSLGVISCLLVTYFSHDLFFTREDPLRFKSVLGLCGYLPYLIWQILLANLQVAYIVLHPRMLELIDPHLFRFDSTLKRPFSKITMAQSITLTPGTITVNIHENQFAVYALTKEAAAELPGEMERRVAKALEFDA